MKFNEILTKFRNNERLPEKKLTGGEPEQVTIFRNYLVEKQKEARRYATIYVIVILALILFCIVTVIVRKDLSDSFKFIIGGESATVLIFVRLLNGLVKISQNSLDLMALLDRFSDQPDLQKQVLDALIDDIKKRRGFFK
jgi:hypothetical protein